MKIRERKIIYSKEINRNNFENQNNRNQNRNNIKDMNNNCNNRLKGNNSFYKEQNLLNLDRDSDMFSKSNYFGNKINIPHGHDRDILFLRESQDNDDLNRSDYIRFKGPNNFHHFPPYGDLNLGPHHGHHHGPHHGPHFEPHIPYDFPHCHPHGHFGFHHGPHFFHGPHGMHFPHY